MIGRVFRIFRERKGLLKTLNLWEWYERLDPHFQRKVKEYYMLKVVRNMNFPYRAEHFDRVEVRETAYTKRTFLATIAQTALLEGDYETAEWLYTEALKMEGSPYEAHLILNDLALLARKIGDTEKMRKYCEEDLRLFPEYREELRERAGGNLPPSSTLGIYIYLLKREGREEEARSLLESMRREGVEPILP